MLGVVEAYNGLLDIAARGREFFHGQVYYPQVPDNDPRMSQSVGHGYDFVRSVTVPSVGGQPPAEGTASLRVIRLTNADGYALMLRTRLTWTSPFGEHQSYACYELLPEAIEYLSNAPVPDEGPSEEEIIAMDPTEVSALLFDTMAVMAEHAAPYQAEWLQKVPESGSIQRIGEAHDYHSQAIMATAESEPQLLCMLSDMDMGMVERDEPARLFEWVRQQPEVA